MSDHDALLRAVCEFPEDNIPRLIYADLMDESGNNGRAIYIRLNLQDCEQLNLGPETYWGERARLLTQNRENWLDSGGFRGAPEQIRDSANFSRGFVFNLWVRNTTDKSWLTAENIARMAASSPITNLDLSGNLITQSELQKYTVFPQLRILDLTSGRMTTLPPCINQFKTLRKLSLRDNRLSFLGPNAFSDLKDLKDLDLSNNPLSNDSLAAVAGLTSLVRLNLNGTHINRQETNQLLVYVRDSLLPKLTYCSHLNPYHLNDAHRERIARNPQQKWAGKVGFGDPMGKKMTKKNIDRTDDGRLI